MQKWKSNIDSLALGKLLKHMDRYQNTESEKPVSLTHYLLDSEPLPHNAPGPHPGSFYRQRSLPLISFPFMAAEVIYPATVFHPIILLEKVCYLHRVRYSLQVGIQAIVSGHFLVLSL